MSIFGRKNEDSKSPEKPGDASYKGTIIVGTPRSGTTMLRRLLDAHPDLCCPGETFLFRGCARLIEHDTISTGFDYGVIGALEGLGYEREEVLRRIRTFAFSFYDELAARAGKKSWIAKTAVDSFYLPQIDEIFGPHVRFICILRHGLDVVCSMDEFSRDLQTYISELHDYISLYPRPYEAFAHAWSDVTKDILHLSEKRPHQCHILRYEDLVRNPDEELEKITGFLKLPPLGTLASKILSKGEVSGIGDWKSYKKSDVDTASISRWKENLPAVTVENLAAIVNPVLEQAGYDPVTRGSADDSRRRQELARMLMQSKS